MKIIELVEARSNPLDNVKVLSGKQELLDWVQDNVDDQKYWGVSMTSQSKLGINPKAGISEDTPKGIYFYPLQYFTHMVENSNPLPWGDTQPYCQLFEYDPGHIMIKQTQVPFEQLRAALSQYCPESVIQATVDEGEYNSDPYWFIYFCIAKMNLGDETNIVRWNKVLRDLGFTCVVDFGAGWIAENEPYQGVVLDPRIIRQHKTFGNRNPTQQRRLDLQGLVSAITRSSYFSYKLYRQSIGSQKLAIQQALPVVAKSILGKFLGKTTEEAESLGFDSAIQAAIDKIVEIISQTQPGK